MPTTDTNAKPNPLRKIDYAGVGVCAALTVLVYASGLAPLVEQKTESVKRRSELNDKRELARKATTSLTSLKRELAHVEQKLAASPLQLKPVSAVNQRIADLTQLAAAVGVKLDEIHPGAGKHGTHYDTIPITLTGLGSYRTGAIFLRRLHQSYPDIGVTGFELSGNPAAPNEPARLKLELNWFAAPIDR